MENALAHNELSAGINFFLNGVFQIFACLKMFVQFLYIRIHDLFVTFLQHTLCYLGDASTVELGNNDNSRSFLKVSL